MDKEIFDKKLSTMLDILSSTAGNNAIIRADSEDDKSLFEISASEFYLFNMSISDRGPVIAWLKDVSKDDILGMFSDYAISATAKMYISLPV